MPLPPALLQRLAKRGLVEKNESVEDQPQDNEEIIAEDYDEVEEPSQYDNEPIVRRKLDNPWTANIKKRITEGTITGYKSCPNKYNIYHKCSLFCVTFWNGKEKQPSGEYFLRKTRLLKRFPLPKNWVEVFDSGCAAHYYWNTQDDTVSWLSPSHPDAVISKSAATIRKEMEEATEDQPDDDDGRISTPPVDDLASLPLPAESTAPFIPMPPPPMLKRPKNRDLDKTIRMKNEKRSRGYKPPKDLDVLDPMDPAAYSDIPRGTWSSGLEQETSKTGVDSTVSGVMFQMRPYPSPGQILQANAGRSKKDQDNSNSDSE